MGQSAPSTCGTSRLPARSYHNSPAKVQSVCTCHERPEACRICKAAKLGIWASILKYHRSIGLSHLLFFGLLCSYTFFGAGMFWWLELENEEKLVVDNDAIISKMIDDAAENMRQIAMTSNETLEDELKDLYIAVLKQDGKYLWSTFDKLERNGDGTIAWAWTYGAAIYFVIQVWTTVGYGAINPATYLGKVMVIVYGTLTFPHGMTAIRDFSVAALNGITRFYARIVFKIRELRGIAVSDKTKVSLNTFHFFIIVALYMLGAGFMVYFMDQDGAVWSGMSLYDAMYYSFVSVATIGMGDVLPNNVTYHPFIMIVLFFGMPLMRIVNRNYYLGLENAVNGTAEAIHIKLDKMLGVIPEDEAPAVITAKRRSERTTDGVEDDKMSTTSSSEDDDEKDQRTRLEMMNNFTIRSIPTLLKSRNDVFNGEFGRVTLCKGDLTQ